MLEDAPSELSRLLKDDCSALTELPVLLDVELLVLESVLLVPLELLESSEIRLLRSASSRPP